MPDESPATTDQDKYDVKIEDVGPAKKRLTITVPPDVIAEKIEESMGTLATQTTLPGFRKGHAPKALLERRFGTTVRSETKNQLVADAYSTALDQHDVKPVGEPEPVQPLDDLKLEVGKPLTFALDVEVVPQFDLPDLEKLEVKKPVMDVPDQHIDFELQRQCLQLGESQPIDSDFREGDRLLGPGSTTLEGEQEPFFTHDNIDIIVPGAEDGGRGQILGLLVDNLASLLADKTVGDTITVETVGPEAHERVEIRGKKLTVEITLREAYRVNPATIDAVVEHYGLASEGILREQIKLALEQRRDEEQRNAMRQQVYDYLAHAVDFGLPEALSARQAGRMLERQRLEMLYQGGMSIDEVETRLAELRAETEAQSRDRLKLSFILHRLAEHFDIQVSDQEVNGRIAAIAAQRGVRPDKLRAELVQSGGITQIASQIREHKAVDRVIDQATVTEIPSEEWNELVAQRAGAHSEEAETPKKKTTKKTGKKKQ